MNGLQTAVQSYHKAYTERLQFNASLAESLRLGPRQVPEIYRLLPPICEAFGIPEPELYLAHGPINAFTTGHTRTAITIYSGLVEDLRPDEIEAVLAHECGHILCQHMLYHSMAAFLTQAASVGSTAAIPVLSTLLQVASVPIRVAIGAWARKSELSADRAAAAYMGNTDVITRLMLRFAGISARSKLTYDIDLFASQALEFEALRESKWDRFLQWQVGQASTHPLLAVRVREIQSWSSTAMFERLAALAEPIRTAPRCSWCGQRMDPAWQHCAECGAARSQGQPALPAPRAEHSEMVD